MVPITRLRTTKRTVGVNQLLREVHMERVEETDSANMAELGQRDGEREICWGKKKKEEGKGHYEKWVLGINY